ncbi:MAG: DsrE family protein [Succinivibrio sp.]|nr:DsrE family protein [Succinivibrio sp.]
MELLIIIKSSPCNSLSHQTVNFIVNRAYEDKLEIKGIFFRLDAVSITSLEMEKRSDLYGIQTLYTELKDKFGISLFVCGGDLQEKGISVDSVRSEFTLSGNAELSMMIASCDKVLEL